jgi:hypothetical protein
MTNNMPNDCNTADAPPGSGAAHGSVTAEQWWTDHAKLLAEKMKIGGVKEFRIFLNYRGNYEFEVVPTASPNDNLTDAGPVTPASGET